MRVATLALGGTLAAGLLLRAHPVAARSPSLLGCQRAMGGVAGVLEDGRAAGLHACTDAALPCLLAAETGEGSEPAACLAAALRRCGRGAARIAKTAAIAAKKLNTACGALSASQITAPVGGLGFSLVAGCNVGGPGSAIACVADALACAIDDHVELAAPRTREVLVQAVPPGDPLDPREGSGCLDEAPAGDAFETGLTARALGSCQRQIESEARHLTRFHRRVVSACIVRLLQCALADEGPGASPERRQECFARRAGACRRSLYRRITGPSGAATRLAGRIGSRCHGVGLQGLLAGLGFRNLSSRCTAAGYGLDAPGADPATLGGCLARELRCTVERSIGYTHPRAGALLDEAGLGEDLPCVPGLPTQAGFGSVSVYGTLRSLGIELELAGDVNGNATADVAYRLEGDPGSFLPALPLARTGTGRLAGSILGLEPGRSYEVQVTLSDPDGVSEGSRVVSAATRPEPVTVCSGRTFFVAPWGDDTASGDAGAPFATIQHGVQAAGPGDTVRIEPGVYRESVVIDHSGTEGAPICVVAGGPGAVLTGADPGLETPGSGLWRDEGGGVYSASIDFATGYVAAGGVRLYHHGSLAALRSPPPGVSGGWTAEGGRLYVALPGGGSPEATGVEAARLDYGLLVDGASYVVVDGLELHTFGTSPFGKGIYLRDAGRIVVRRASIHNVNVGIWIRGVAAEEELIEQNTISDSGLTGWPWDAVKGTDAEGRGIFLEGGRGTVVRGNTVRGTFDGIGPSLFSPPAVYDEALNRDLDVHDNLIEGVLDDGLEPEGACVNVRLWGNTVRDARMGLSLAPVTMGPVYAVRNVLEDFTASGVKLGNSTAGPVFLFHNTVVTSLPDTNGIEPAGPWTNVTLRNNLVVGTRYALEDVHLAGFADLDYDLLFTSDPTRFVKLAGVRYPGLPALAADGYERHGLAAPAGFVDQAAGDLRLAAGSPAIDSGVELPNVNHGYAGSGPDLGALERP